MLSSAPQNALLQIGKVRSTIRYVEGLDPIIRSIFMSTGRTGVLWALLASLENAPHHSTGRIQTRIISRSHPPPAIRYDYRRWFTAVIIFLKTWSKEQKGGRTHRRLRAQRTKAQSPGAAHTSLPGVWLARHWWKHSQRRAGIAGAQHTLAGTATTYSSGLCLVRLL